MDKEYIQYIRKQLSKKEYEIYVRKFRSKVSADMNTGTRDMKNKKIYSRKKKHRNKL